MDDTERMEAVKRAYAEIILNTAAESAARILASEKKAMGLQRSLATTKQDAVDMMLRLKSLMDSKINEAETRNLLHARRIQELELQLEKAKSVIVSLQSDLEREREVNKNKTQQADPIIIEEEENTSSYYQNVISTDNSSCSVKDTLRTGTGTSIGTNQGSKVRSRNRLTQRVRAFDQSKDPKGGQSQNLGKNRKSKKSRENGSSDRKVFLTSDPPRRSRTKSNYVKISKFGMKIDGNVSQNGNKVLKQCTEKEKEAVHNLDSGAGFITDEAPVGLELIADNIDKEDDKPAIAIGELIAVDPKSTETKADLEELETPVPDPTADQGLRSIKYTFRRKRKRGLSENTDEVIPPAVVPVSENNKDENEKNEENKEVVSDSPRSNRRMVQVARQLISLSTKKW